MKPALKMALAFAAGAIVAQIAGWAPRLWDGSRAAQPPADPAPPRPATVARAANGGPVQASLPLPQGGATSPVKPSESGDAAGADTLDPQSLMHEILEKSPPAAVQAARTEIARERAGMPPLPSGTIAERYLRYLTTVGDSLQSALEPALGAQQAGAVRDALATSSSVMSGCAR